MTETASLGAGGAPDGLTALAGLLDAICAEQPFHVGWALEATPSGERVSRHGDVVVPSGSTRKVAILATALALVNAGELRLAQPVEVTPGRFAVAGSGVFQYFAAPFTITLQDVLTMMIIVSDNTCTGWVCETVGLARVNAFCQAAGLTGTSHREGVPTGGSGGDKTRQPLETMNVTTPDDQRRLCGLLLRGTSDVDVAAGLDSTPELCRLALRILGRQKLNARMPALLPPAARVAHKTGTNGGRNYHDGGIVSRGDQPRFILTVYTEGVPPLLPDGEAGSVVAGQLIARLTRACWDSLA